MPNRSDPFSKALPLLVRAYQEGLLVPFIGAGMSHDRCPLWPEMVARLEAEASRGEGGPAHVARTRTAGSSDELIRRVHHATAILRRQGPNMLAGALRRVLYGQRRGARRGVPRQATLLANIAWPLVISTNYDDVYASAVRSTEDRVRRRSKRKQVHSGLGEIRGITADELLIVGRSVPDCHRVMSALTERSNPLLWTIQGFLSADDTGRPNPRRTEPGSSQQKLRLERELVVGHEEYRRLTHAELPFRRAFATAFRSRSFLFLGSGCSEHYFLDMFDEVLETYGPNPRPHYACVPKNTVDVEFLRTRFNIHALEYQVRGGDHDHLLEWLVGLRVAISKPAARAVSWTYHLDPTHIGRRSARMRGQQKAETSEALTVTIGKVPLRSVNDAPGECTALSAGLNDDHTTLYLTGSDKPSKRDTIYSGVRRVSSYLRQPVRPLDRRDGARIFAKHWIAPDESVIAVCAWRTRWKRDLNLIRPATHLALDWAAMNNRSVLHMSLIAAGDSRHFPASFSLVEIVRAFRLWRHADYTRAVRLAIHLTDPGVVGELTSGRLALLELLTEAAIRFSVEVLTLDGEVERQTARLDESTSLLEVASLVGLAKPGAGKSSTSSRTRSKTTAGWRFEVYPSRTPAEGEPRNLARHRTKSLRDLAVLPGSTVRFTPPQ